MTDSSPSAWKSNHHAADRLRIWIFNEPRPIRRFPCEFDSPLILIGRFPTDPSSGESIAFQIPSDPDVSRIHARIGRGNDGWWIEDLGSRYGTFVGERDIRGAGRVGFVPGDCVRTANTSWIVLGSGHIAFRTQNILIQARIKKLLSQLLYHCRMPVIEGLRATNIGDGPSQALDLSFRIGTFLPPCKREIPKLSPGASIDLQAVGHTELSLEMLRAVTHAHPVSFTCRDGSNGPPLFEIPVWVGTPRDWAIERESLMFIAAFSHFDHPVTDTIVNRASQTLSSNPDQLATMRAIYHELANHWNILYEQPRTVHATEIPGGIQTLRTPHAIFPQFHRGLSSPPAGQATCLDLALLLSGCMENVRLRPLIVLFGDPGCGSLHALVGCWSGNPLLADPILEDRDEILGELEAGLLWLIEPTGIARNPRKGRGALGFEEARRAAEELMRGPAPVCAVDLSTIRRPPWSILPLHNPFEPDVLNARRLARRLAESRRSHLVKSADLLAGVVAANGPLVSLILDELGIDPNGIVPEPILQTATSNDQWHPDPSEFIETENVRICLEGARIHAFHGASSSIRERDLLWSLIDLCRRSISLGTFMTKRGIEPERFAAILNRESPRTAPLIQESTEGGMRK